MLDLHTHVLPGIDDGPRTMSEALELLRFMADDGVQHVVATPHIYPGVYNNTPETIETVFAQLHAAAQAASIPLTLSWGAEVRLCPEMLDWLQDERLTCLGKGTGGWRTVLVELPDGQVPMGADKVMARLRERKLIPLIAHPERNRAVMESLDHLKPLIEAGAKVQLTAASLLGEFGERAHNTARLLLATNWVAAVASDAHNLRGRKPRLAAAKQWLVQEYGNALAEELTEHSPARLVGMGQLVFDHDGVVLRDLTDDVTPGLASETTAPIFTLLDMPALAPAAMPLMSQPLEQGWRPSQPASWTDELGHLPGLSERPARSEALDTDFGPAEATSAAADDLKVDAWSLSSLFDEMDGASKQGRTEPQPDDLGDVVERTLPMALTPEPMAEGSPSADQTPSPEAAVPVSKPSVTLAFKRRASPEPLEATPNTFVQGDAWETGFISEHKTFTQHGNTLKVAVMEPIAAQAAEVALPQVVTPEPEQLLVLLDAPVLPLTDVVEVPRNNEPEQVAASVEPTPVTRESPPANRASLLGGLAARVDAYFRQRKAAQVAAPVPKAETATRPADTPPTAAAPGPAEDVTAVAKPKGKAKGFKLSDIRPIRDERQKRL